MLKVKLTKYFWQILAISAFLVWLVVFSLPDKKLHLIFCDVGQGDAILLSKGFDQVLIDGGPNEKVLACVAKNMPFFDKTIEVVILTHPDFDHVTGLNWIWEKYKVNYFLSGPEGSEGASYLSLLEKVKRSKTKVINPFAGQKIKIGEMVWESWWPAKGWVVERLEGEGEKWEMGLQTSSFVLGAKTEHRNFNDFSLVFLVKYQNWQLLLMGDADSRVQDEIMRVNDLAHVDILKFPHHGSKTGIKEDFLAKIKPKEAVISVGKNNYGHPTQEALELLERYKVKVRRTDVEGNIEYVF